MRTLHETLDYLKEEGFESFDNYLYEYNDCVRIRNDYKNDRVISQVIADFRKVLLRVENYSYWSNIIMQLKELDKEVDQAIINNDYKLAHELQLTRKDTVEFLQDSLIDLIHREGE